MKTFSNCIKYEYEFVLSILKNFIVNCLVNNTEKVAIVECKGVHDQCR